MERRERKFLCMGVVALLLLGLIGTGGAVSSHVNKGEAANDGLKGVALGKARQEQVEEETQNAGEDMTIRIQQQREEVRAMDNGTNGLALGKDMKEIAHNRIINGPIIAVHGGTGFALNDGDFHVLSTQIVSVRHLRPSDIRGLMEANKSIEEIRAEIMEGEGSLFHQGYLRLGVNNRYTLTNIIIVNETGENRTFTADIWSDSRKEGNIWVTVRNYEGFRIGEGNLTMSEGDYAGKYRVLLTIYTPPPGSWRG